MVEEFVSVGVQARKRLLGFKIVVRLLRHVMHGRIAIDIGAPEGGVDVIRQAIVVAIQNIIVGLIFRMLTVHHIEAVAGRHWGWSRLGEGRLRVEAHKLRRWRGSSLPRRTGTTD